MPWCNIRGCSPYSIDKWAWQAMPFIRDRGRGSWFRWSWFDCEIFFSQLQRIFDLPARSSSQMYWRFTWRFNLNNGFRWIRLWSLLTKSIKYLKGAAMLPTNFFLLHDISIAFNQIGVLKELFKFYYFFLNIDSLIKAYGILFCQITHKLSWKCPTEPRFVENILLLRLFSNSAFYYLACVLLNK